MRDEEGMNKYYAKETEQESEKERGRERKKKEDESEKQKCVGLVLVASCPVVR